MSKAPSPPGSGPLGSGDALGDTLKRLAATIDARAAAGDAEASWTAKLLARGPEACARKFAEEAAELVQAVSSQDDKQVAAEAGDVLYHLLVALRARGVSLDDVAAVLAAREGVSGLDEKAGRGK